MNPWYPWLHSSQDAGIQESVGSGFLATKLHCSTVAVPYESSCNNIKTSTFPNGFSLLAGELREQQQLPVTMLESNGTIHIQMLILLSSCTADHTKLLAGCAQVDDNLTMQTGAGLCSCFGCYRFRLVWATTVDF